MSRLAASVDDEALHRKLRAAVEGGLITPEVARAIEQTEVEEAPDRDGGSRLTPLVAEAIGFVGAALAVVAVILVVSQFWADLRPWTRVALPALAAVALLVAGAFLHGHRSGAIARLASFLWLLSAGSFAFAVALLGLDVLALTDSRIALTTGWSTAAYAAVLWIIRRRAPQQAATFAAFVAAAAATLDLVDPALMDYAGLLVWAVGVAWLLLAWGRVASPVGTGYALGGVAALVGPMMLSPVLERAALLLGLLTAVVLVVASVLVRRSLLLWLGALGVFVYVPWLVFEFFGEALGAPLALLMAGVALIGVALVIARLHVSKATEAGEIPR